MSAYLGTNSSHEVVGEVTIEKVAVSLSGQACKFESSRMSRVRVAVSFCLEEREADGFLRGGAFHLCPYLLNDLSIREKGHMWKDLPSLSTYALSASKALRRTSPLCLLLHLTFLLVSSRDKDKLVLVLLVPLALPNDGTPPCLDVKRARRTNRVTAPVASEPMPVASRRLTPIGLQKRSDERPSRRPPAKPPIVISEQRWRSGNGSSATFGANVWKKQTRSRLRRSARLQQQHDEDILCRQDEHSNDGDDEDVEDDDDCNGTNDDELDEDNDNESDDEEDYATEEGGDDATKERRKRRRNKYMPPPDSPLGQHLDQFQRDIAGISNGKKLAMLTLLGLPCSE